MNDSVWVAQLMGAELVPVNGLPGRWKQFVVPTRSNLGMSVSLGELAPDERLHWRASEYPESFCAIAGQGAAWWQIGEQEFSSPLQRGKIFYTPRHVLHDIVNGKSAPLIGISFKVEQAGKNGMPSPRAEIEGSGVKTMDSRELVAAPGILGRWKRYVLPTEHNGGMICGLGELPPRSRMGWHAHPESEMFYILSGTGRAYWKSEGKEHQALLCPGMAFYKIGEVPHDMENTSDESMTGIMFKIKPVGR